MRTGLFYLAPLFIYFPRLIPGIETQPFLVLAFCLFGLLTTINARQRTLALGLAVTVIFFGSIAAAGSSRGYWTLSLTQLLVGPLVFLGAVALRAPAPDRATLRITTMVLWTLAVIELVAPGLYFAAGSILLDRVPIADGHRGVSLLNPEPTYAAITITYLFILTLWSRAPDCRSWKLEIALVSLLVLTLSTYAALILAVLAAFRWPRSCIAAAVFLLFLPMAGELAPVGEDSFRAVVALSRLLTVDFSNLLDTISAVDESLGARVLSIAIGVDSATKSTFGFGLGCDAMPTALRELNANYTLTNPVLVQILDNGCLKPPSYLTAVGLGMGRLGFLFVGLIVACLIMAIRRESRHLWLLPLALGLLELAVQAQITNPAPWMLLYFSLLRKPARRVDVPEDSAISGPDKKRDSGIATAHSSVVAGQKCP